MARANQITEPVSRGLLASIGTVQNLGTAGQGAVGGGSNGTKGGLVDNGGTSYQNAAIAPTAQIKDIYSGPSGAGNTESTTDPINAQYAVTSTEYYEPRTSTVVASAAEGYHSDLPRSNKAAERAANDSPAVRNSNTTFGEKVYGNGEGIETDRVYGSVTNLENVRNNFNETLVNTGSDRVDGKKGLGDPTAQSRDNGTFGIQGNNFVNDASAPSANGLLADEFTGLQSN